MNSIDSVLPATDTASWATPAATLRRCAGSTAQWQIGLAANLYVLCSHVFQTQNLRLFCKTRSTTGVALSSQTHFSDLLEELTTRSQIAISEHIEIQITPNDASTCEEKIQLTAYESKGLIDICLNALCALDNCVLARSLQTLIAQTAREPNTVIDSLTVLHKVDRKRVLQTWNSSPSYSGTLRPLHRCFEEQVERTPNALALIDGTQRWHYDALNRAANRLASHLREAGIGVGDRVGLYLPRSSAMVLGMLGVMKSGAAFVPLDINQPPARLHKMATRVQGHALLFSRAHDTNIPQSDTLTARCIETLLDTPSQDSNLPGGSGVDDPAYVIFTSGSTGEPKGVIGLHRGMCNRVQWMLEHIPLANDAICCQKAAFGFIDCIAEVLSPLLCGRPLVIVPEHHAHDPNLLVEFLAHRQITHLTSVPTMLRMVLSSVGDLRERLPALRTWICSGEELPADLQARFFECCDAQLYNFYGPSEASIEVSTWHCTREHKTSPIPIGRPIGDTQLYVLDKTMRPVLPGMIGELYIGGVGLARGYLGDPQQTQISFVQNPFSTAPGARLYRTGDLARHRADGVLEFRGRIGRDIKIRGNRVALAEIESAIVSLKEIDEAVVIAQNNHHGATYLVAYIVSASSTSLELESLRSQLASSLPQYMMPAYFVQLDRLPKTLSGKLDRARLPNAKPQHILREPHTDPPTNKTQRQIAHSFSTILGVPITGIDDNFFTLGGDSLQATLLLTQLKTQYALTLSLREFFEKPTVRAFAQHLKAHQQNVLDNPARVRDESNTNEIEGAQNIAHPTETYALSHAQERLCFIDQLDAGRGYATSCALRFEGPLLISALENALAQLWVRHPALRAIFPQHEGRAVCQILAPTALPLTAIEVNDSPEQARPTRTQIKASIQRSLRENPFDLAKGPLVRTTLFHLQPSVHVVVLSVHHIVCDGLSIEILVRELARLYDAQITHSELELETPVLSYVEYAQWERSQEGGQRMQALATFWREHMRDTPQVLELPLDYPRPARWLDQGATQRLRLEPELVEALHRMALQTGVSLFMLTHAVFAVLLSKLSGRHDLCIATPTANRQRAEVSDTVGMFVNTVALRTRLSDDAPFSTLLAQVKETCLDAFDHQDYPFERLVQQLKPERSLTHPPLLQVSFALERPLPKQRAGGCEIHSDILDSNIALFDLSLILEPTAHEIQVAVVYNTALFAPETITRWIGHYQRLLQAITQNPDTRIGELSMLTASEQRILRAFGTGQTQEQQTPWRSVLTHFHTHAHLTPEATALVSDTRRLSYAQLNTLANQLAMRVQAHGEVCGQLVAICGRRSPDLVIGVLALMKLGAAWLPLDPSYPPARLRFMLQDSGASLLLAHREYAAPLIDGKQLPWLALDQSEADRQTVSQTDQASHSMPDEDTSALRQTSLAYLIYTSGSTGKPKGVMISHGALENAWRAWDKAYALSARCHSHLQTASFSFDVFAGDLVRALCSGAKLVMADRAMLLTPSALLKCIDTEQIDCADLSPIVMSMLAQHLVTIGRDLSRFKLLVLGTDAWNVDSYRRWQRLLGPTTRLINAYGVTEATVASTYYDPAHAPLPACGPVPIGIPLPGTIIRLLDRRQHLVAIGIAGEICIGGAGVALGYHNRPALNAERFYCDKQGLRYYRTGDLGRWRADGTLEFLGRMDAQIKIRGFRVEPGEVEGVIASHPAVRQVAVIALSDALSGKRLRAAVVSHEPGALSAAQIRRFVAQQLPEPLRPSCILMLAKLPTSPNGKIDRQAIARLDERQDETTPLSARARTPEQLLIGEILSRLLELERMGVDDNFFEHGGHSLLAVQAVTQISKTLDVVLTVRAFFEHPTIAGLAQHAWHLRADTSTEPFERPVRATRSATQQAIDVPCSPAQSRMLFLHNVNDGGDSQNDKHAKLSYDIPALFHIKGPLDIPALMQSLEHIAQRHEILRSSFVAPNAQTLHARQYVHPHANMPISLVERPAAALHWIESLTQDIAEVISRPFDLQTGPLIRAVIFQREENEHALLLHMHHMVSDAWSLGVYIRELRALYNAARLGKKAALEPLHWQYRDYALWQRKLLESDLLTRQLDYWRHQLADAPALLELPGDRARPPVSSHRGGIFYHNLSAKLVAELGRLGSHLHASLYMILLAALGVLLYRRSHQDDLCIGSPIANRGDDAFENLIGFFVNTLVMRLRLDGETPFSELVSQVRETALDAYDNASLPFERLVEALKPQRSLSHSPLFQVVLALQNVPDEDFTLEGLSVQSLDLHNGTAKFDLLIIAQPHKDHLRLEVEYSKDLFDRTTIERMINSYETLLRAVVHAPQTTLADLPLLPQSEASLINRLCKPDDYALGQARCLHHVFETQARQTPHALALIDTDGSALTWRTLEHCANALAHTLQTAGVEPNTTVGVFCDRSGEQIIAILGILKAGGAYVPLDPAYPHERLQSMADDAQLRLVLTHSRTTCPDLGVAQHSVADATRHRVASPPRSDVTPDDLIYVTFTSGSTGRPKGIAMHHAALWNLIAWHQQETPLTAATTLQYAPLSFDVSFQEIFTSIINGGTLVLIDDHDRRDPFRVWQRIEKVQAQRLFLPTAALKPLAAAAGALPRITSSLREIWVGGEQMRIDADIRALFTRLPHCRLINYYGPSECHAVSWAEQPADPQQWQETPHVGRPIANTSIHILDERGRHLPMGVPGELCITGACVAKGYLGRAGQNVANFVPDPFSEADENRAARMYKTGDIAYYDNTGNIHIIGRRDCQTKIRGFRIETAEIETVLLRHPKIDMVIVEVTHPGEERAQLLAWIVTASGATLTAEDVQRFAQTSLADYMVPTNVLFLRQFPINHNGKIDRDRLRALAKEALNSKQHRPIQQTTGNPKEQQVTQIFADILGLERVGCDENFFDLGGSSILAMSLVARLRSTTGLTLSVSALIQHATPAAITAHLYANHITPTRQTCALIPLQTRGTLPAFYFVHPVGGNILCYQALARRLTSPLYGIQSSGLNAQEHPHQSIEEMAGAYLDAIRAVAPSEPLHLGGWSMGGLIAYEMARQYVASGGDVASVVLLDTGAPGTYADTRTPTNLTFTRTLLADLQGALGITLTLDENAMLEMTSSERLEHILHCALHADSIPHDLGTDGMRRLLQVYTHNMQALIDYEPNAYEGPITLICARDRTGSTSVKTQRQDWQRRASGPLEAHQVPGNHYSFLQGKGAGIVAKMITHLLRHSPR